MKSLFVFTDLIGNFSSTSYIITMKQLLRVERFFRGKVFPSLFAFFFSLSAHTQNGSGELVVPLVFHIISNDPDTITDQEVIAAVADLNNAFAHAGPYASGSDGVNTGIRFCLAKVAPDGGNTTGITRTTSVFGDFDSDLENDRLKKLVSWNTSQYCNIWIVSAVRNEFLTSFSCGQWSRRHDTGYGTYDTTGDFIDGIVAKEFGSSLASLMGSYLSLNPTFVPGSCNNTNCDIDGDGICDTPPASVPGSSCTAVQNSCNTDSLSGFAHDVADLVTNFMSLSGPCVNSFTAGQAAKMRSVLTNTRKTLIARNLCDPPCSENIIANFTRDNWTPKSGDIVHFTSISSGGTNYQWIVNGVPAGSNSPTLTLTFPTTGKTTVTLRVYNTNPSCFASYSDDVLVNCGVIARFTPDVRQIASKESIMLDSILFSNKSVNATSYKWWLSNDNGISPETVSDAFDLNYTFKIPGNYSVWLIASNGSCSDTTEIFKFPVFDPTSDGTISLSDTRCYQQTKILANISICNGGYAAIPAGTPVSFYDADPRNGHANKLSTQFLTPAPVAGKCCSSFTTVVDVKRSGLDQLFAVFNDIGNGSLPNTNLVELSYLNNINDQSNFQFHVKARPDSAVLKPGDSLLLTAAAGPDSASYTWSTAQDLSCTSCDSTFFVAEYKIYSVTKKITATSNYGCIDSAFAILQIPPADDYRIHVDSIDCAGADSMHVAFTLCNGFNRGHIPMGLRVFFYDSDPSENQANLLDPVFLTKEIYSSNCASFETFIQRPVTGKLYAVVNENLQNPANYPGIFYEEMEYDNNQDTFPVKSFNVYINPSDTTVNLHNPVQLTPVISGGRAVNYKWEPLQYLSCAECSSPVAMPDTRTEYQLTIQNEYACNASGKAIIKLFSGGKVNIPNGFSPNDDGHNDIFYVLASDEVKMLKKFEIFNRWGQQVFQVEQAEANDPRFGWNGLMNGKPVEPGTYVYYVTVLFVDGTTQLYKGTVTLVR
jgi:gliding motility-associated-like protein